MSTASGTMTSSSTGMDPGCAGDIVEGLSGADNKGLISDMCGVFVQADASSMTGGAGTQADPYTSLQVAIAAAGNSKRVYACSNAPYAEAVTVSEAVEIYGGFTCDKGWVFKAATRSLITGAVNKVSLTLTTGAEGARIEGFKITSASATGKTGQSSVAVAVAAIDATLVECDVEAGDGAEGADGAASAGGAPKGMDAPAAAAASMNACINPTSVKGGPPGATMCDDGVTTAGGAGGKGGITSTTNGDGASGTNGTPIDASTGKGGAGQGGAIECANGLPGKKGVTGVAGAASTSPGTLALTGLQSSPDADGTDGKAGTKGQGGGGGGAAKSGMFCDPGTADGNGASGGGGGAGGCGGKGGGGGKAGGSSLALISMGTELKLTNVKLKAGKGGNGGKGAVGQGGGAFGLGAVGGAASGFAGSKLGCQGGNGGTGGDGGAGGGGRGGHSIGLAVMGTPKAIPMLTPGTPGDGGLGGTGAPAGGKGLAGATCDFKASPVTCTK